ncbi:hypothetical protein [Herbidospora sp. NBRC 101105]|uniref:hypothetical protein n=1 Tax=Herbidospora sp. NBRC 101105 TaxID=3032195 RepID=UPI0024A5706D|nr:hypothetical protein [Herbidospora sp. NBRC 101105]GLX93931.1 hypothetical protein Hesp01_18810 [Herbidospora sp. NBRC 101105]
MTSVTQDWLCGRCGVPTPLDRCPICHAVLVGEVRPAVRYGIAPALPVIVLTMILALVGLAWWTSSSTPARPQSAATPAIGAVPPVTSALASPSESPAPIPQQAVVEQTELDQFTAIDSLLSGSQAARQNLGPAIEAARRCESGGLETIQAVTDARERQLGEVATLEVNLLRNGPELKEALTEAVRASYNADRAYLSAARAHQRRGCTGTMNLDRGESFSRSATAAKRRFVELWSPLEEERLRFPRSADDI